MIVRKRAARKEESSEGKGGYFSCEETPPWSIAKA
jgi:hypothetical protein